MYPSLNGSTIGSIRQEDDADYTATADGTLVVMVIRAKHLPNRRKLDKQSPYVVARIGTVAKKTLAAFRAGQTPEWTHEMRFELSREKKPILKIDVLDETKNDPTPIGNVEIDASVIFTNPENNENGKYIYDKWYDLTLNGRRAGMIYLEMTFYPTAPVLPPKIPIPHEEVVVINEQDDYDTASAMGQSMRSTISSKHKDLPTPPFNQQQQLQQSHMSGTHSHSVADDVFVNLENSNSSKTSSIFLKKFSKYSGSGGGVNSTNSTNIDREVFVSSELDKNHDNSKKGAKKYTLKLAKFTDKFQSKQPISTLWKNSEAMSDNINAEQSTTTSIGTTGTAPKVFSSFNTRRSVSPLSDYGSNDLDQLQRDLSHTQLSDDYNNNNNNKEHTNFDKNIYEPLPEIEFNSPPVPPPHLIISNTEDTYYKSNNDNDNINTSSRLSSTSPRRKPPPPLSSSPKTNNAKSSPSTTNGFNPKFDLSKSTAIPFSADTIGIDDDDDDNHTLNKNNKDILPTQVYLLDQPVKSLSIPSNTHDGLPPVNINSDEIDPKYYAPTPSEHFNRSQRFNNNSITKDDLKIDFRTNQTGYLGNGNFSPSIFQRAVKHNWDDLSTMEDIDYNEFSRSGVCDSSLKPEVPPKIPKGLTESEYYILEKEKYLRDLRGNRI